MDARTHEQTEMNGHILQFKAGITPHGSWELHGALQVVAAGDQVQTPPTLWIVQTPNAESVITIARNACLTFTQSNRQPAGADDWPAVALTMPQR